jgi:thioredoxin
MKMKKLVLVVLIGTLGIAACNSSDGNKTISTENSVDAVQVKTSEGPVQLTKAGFLSEIMDYEKNPEEWVYKGTMPGLIDFYADWCKPCKMTSPILDELAKEYAGKIIIYKVNVDVERELASVFGVQSIPTFLFMPMEGQPALSSGIAQTPEQTKAMFKQQIEEILLKNSNL